MYVFSLIALFALFLEVFTTMPNALVFFLMTMLFFLFCIPVKGQVIKDLELFPNPEQAQETEEQPSEQASERPK
jgi:flagellar biosynthesis component FlhA